MKLKRSHWMLELASDRWSLVTIGGTDSPQPSVPSSPHPGGTWTAAEAPALAEQIATFYSEQELSPGPLIIGLDGSLCLSTQFTIASARQLRKRESLVFQLEETLPLTAEEIVADFMARQRSVFAVAAEVAALEPVVTELARAGIAIEAIVPEVLLAVVEHLKSCDWPKRHHVLWLERAHWELVTIDERNPVSWLRLPAATEALVQTLRAMELATGDQLPITAYGPPETIAEIQTKVAAPRLQPPTEAAAQTLTIQAGRTAARVLDGQIDPPMQLLRGSLAASVKRRSPLARDWRLLQSAAALLLLVLAVSRFSAWQRAEHGLAAHTAAQADVFRELYPEKRVPVGVQTRLASDLRRLKGVRGDTTELPSGVEALAVVGQVLSALPADMRFRLLEIRVENGRLSLSGEVRSHGDADRIAAALRKLGLRVSPPSTQQLPQQGVDFRLTAEVAAAQEKSA